MMFNPVSGFLRSTPIGLDTSQSGVLMEFQLDDKLASACNNAHSILILFLLSFEVFVIPTILG